MKIKEEKEPKKKEEKEVKKKKESKKKEHSRFYDFTKDPKNKLINLKIEKSRKNHKTLAKPKVVTEQDMSKINTFVKNIDGEKSQTYFAEFLKNLIATGTVPVEALEGLPARPSKVGKTRFDQLYDLAQLITFMNYSESTIKGLLGEGGDLNTRLWRVVLPKEYGIASIYLRAPTYQDAFALACDYVMRVSLRLNQIIPQEMTIKVESVTDQEARGMIAFRNKDRKRHARILNFKMPEVTPRQLRGIRLAALGYAMNDPRRSIVRYIEEKEVKYVNRVPGIARISAVDSEVLLGRLKGLKEEEDEYTQE